MKNEIVPYMIHQLPKTKSGSWAPMGRNNEWQPDSMLGWKNTSIYTVATEIQHQVCPKLACRHGPWFQSLPMLTVSVTQQMEDFSLFYSLSFSVSLALSYCFVFNTNINKEPLKSSRARHYECAFIKLQVNSEAINIQNCGTEREREEEAIMDQRV